MTDYDRWLEQPYQEAAERDEAIERLVEEVLEEDEYDPTNADTFLQAIDDAVLYGIKEELAKALKDPNVGHAALGKVIYDAVYDYCYKQADNEAARRYNEGLGGDDDGGDY
jgi:hypothetical protein